MTADTAIGPNQEKWLQALESGDRKQATGFLHMVDGGYCCLGVACELFQSPVTQVRESLGTSRRSFTYNAEWAVAPEYVRDALGLYGCAGTPSDEALAESGYELRSLVDMNDDGVPFDKIAAHIRANPRAYFSEPR